MTRPRKKARTKAIGVMRNPPKPHAVTTMRGRQFGIYYGLGPSWARGACTSRRARRPSIFIDDRAKGKQRLEVSIHEAIHAWFGTELGERKVLRLGHDLARMLWGMGYRAAQRDRRRGRK